MTDDLKEKWRWGVPAGEHSDELGLFYLFKSFKFNFVSLFL